MACPFFVPTSPLDDGGWLHPSRLPLGGGWSGHCSAPGHEGAAPATEELRQFCNLGYAAGCSRLPKERSFDAVRFSIMRDRDGLLDFCFVCESGHLPAEHGILTYDLSLGRWITAHSDSRIQKLVECYLQSYLRRRVRTADTLSATS